MSIFDQLQKGHMSGFCESDTETILPEIIEILMEQSPEGA
jgi:hypothetical protein